MPLPALATPADVPTGACFMTVVDSPDAGGLSGPFVSPRPPAQPGETLWHRWFPYERVPRKHLAYVAKHSDAAARLLGLDPAEIRVGFFAPLLLGTPHDEVMDYPFVATELGEEVLGFVLRRWRTTLALNVGLRGPIVAGALAHEIRHVQQNRLAPWTGTLSPIADYELDAAEFAASYVARAQLRRVA